MSQWDKEPDIATLKRALQNCYMLAARKRTVVHRYEIIDGKEVAIPIGPKSDDPDWDRIIHFCESTGISHSIIRLMKGK